jgi:hypothetical protein
MAVLSRKVLWPLGLSLIAMFWILWKSASIPGRVAVINQSGHGLTEVTVGKARIGELRNGESRVVSLPASEALVVRFRGQRARTWRSDKPLLPGQTMVLYITPDDGIDARGKIGTYAR